MSVWGEGSCNFETYEL